MFIIALRGNGQNRRSQKVQEKFRTLIINTTLSIKCEAAPAVREKAIDARQEEKVIFLLKHAAHSNTHFLSLFEMIKAMFKSK